MFNSKLDISLGVIIAMVMLIFIGAVIPQAVLPILFILWPIIIFNWVIAVFIVIPLEVIIWYLHTFS